MLLAAAIQVFADDVFASYPANWSVQIALLRQVVRRIFDRRNLGVVHQLLPIRRLVPRTSPANEATLKNPLRSRGLQLLQLFQLVLRKRSDRLLRRSIIFLASSDAASAVNLLGQAFFLGFELLGHEVLLCCTVLRRVHKLVVDVSVAYFGAGPGDLLSLEDWTVHHRQHFNNGWLLQVLLRHLDLLF